MACNGMVFEVDTILSTFDHHLYYCYQAPDNYYQVLYYPLIKYLFK